MKWISDNTVGGKIIQAFAIILAIFSGLTANFYHLTLVINSIKPKYHDLSNIHFTKFALDMSFLKRFISSARIILLSIVHKNGMIHHS